MQSRGGAKEVRRCGGQPCVVCAMVFAGVDLSERDVCGMSHDKVMRRSRCASDSEVDCAEVV